MKPYRTFFILLLAWAGCFCGYIVLSNVLVSLAATQVPFGSQQILEWQLGVPMDTYGEEAGYVLVDGNLLVPTARVARLGASVPAGFICGPPVIGSVGLTADFSDWQTYAPGYSPPASGTPIHGGLDFAGDVGLSVVSPMSGVVAWAGPNGAYGNLVAIENDGYLIYLAHLQTLIVAVGQVVSAGQVVGTLGQTGNATGPHVHYSVYGPEGRAVDPRLALLPGQESLCAYK